jgi:Tol biopolymer transport system component
MRTKSSRLVAAAAAVAALLATAACGGGGETVDDASGKDHTLSLKRRQPPPPPPPASDSTLALASASAAGIAADGKVCAVSGDGSKVLFTSTSSTLVSGDTTPFAADIYLKDFNGNGVRRVLSASRNFACVAMTPDANTVIFVADAPNGLVDALGNTSTEPTIMALNLSTGQQTRVSPVVRTFVNVSEYQFAGVSDDGRRVAFIAQPTKTCVIFDCTADGPARTLLRDLGSGALINLEARVRFTTAQGVADGNAMLSPDGRTLAFSSRAAYPEAGDATAGSDVYALDIASSTVRRVSTTASGQALTFADFPGGVGPSFGVQSFLVNSSQIAFYTGADTSAGAAGVFVKDLNTGALTRVLDRNVAPDDGLRTAASFSDDGRKVAYVEAVGGGIDRRELPRVVDLASGARLNAATLTNATVGNGNITTNVLLSRDGRAAAFSNNATNLLGTSSGGAELRAYRKLLP